jgi:hypothetical protein
MSSSKPKTKAHSFTLIGVDEVYTYPLCCIVIVIRVKWLACFLEDCELGSLTGRFHVLEKALSIEGKSTMHLLSFMHWGEINNAIALIHKSQK